MNAKRLYLVLCGVIGLLLIGLLAGTYGADKLLTGQASKLTSLKAKSQALDQEQIILAKAKKEVKTYAGLDHIAHAVVPQDKDQAEAVREIVNIASSNGVSLASISFPASSLGGTPGSATSTSSSASSASAAASAQSKAKALSQLQPVKNISGVYLLQIVVAGDPNQPVPYNQFINFLSDLEHNRRTAQVSSIVLQPDAHNRNHLSFTLTLNEYIKP
jgi:hypothetical protein